MCSLTDREKALTVLKRMTFREKKLARSLSLFFKSLRASNQILVTLKLYSQHWRETEPACLVKFSTVSVFSLNQNLAVDAAVRGGVGLLGRCRNIKPGFVPPSLL